MTGAAPLTDCSAGEPSRSPIRDRIRRAAAEGDFRTVVGLVQEQFIEVWYGLPPSELHRILDAVPPWLRARHPFADYLFELTGGAVRHRRESDAEQSFVGDARVNGGVDRASVPVLGAISVLELRLQGRMHAAMAALERAQKSVRTRNALVDSTRGWDLFAAVQAGNTALLAGSLSEARAFFTRGQLVPATDGLAHLSRDCSIKLALIEGLFGDRVQAIEELSRAERTPRTESWIEPVLDAALVLARATLGLDEGALDTLELQDVGEMWPFYVMIECERLERRGGRAAVAAFVRTLVDAGLPGSAGDGFPGSVLPVCLARTWSDAGNLAAARREIKAADPALFLTAIVSSEIALGSGQNDRVLRLLFDARMTWADFRQLDEARRAIAAAAHARSGDLVAARALLHRSGGAPVDVTRLKVSERVRATLSALDGDEISAETNATPSKELTQRESEVLALLVRGLRREEIASELFVSINTVKSQVRSLYRKLGVSTRDDAVRVAHQRGLVT